MRWWIAVLGGALLPGSVLAQQAVPPEDPDLARIPSAVHPGAEAESGAPAMHADARSLRSDLDSAITGADQRTLAPGEDADDRKVVRSSLEGVYSAHGSSGFSGLVSGRLNAMGDTTSDGRWERSVGFDLRELYAGWSSPTQWYVDAGRINVRNGVALGFNPTDFFKARTLINQASADPSAIRDDRLGTAMVRLQKLWTQGSLSLVIAPKTGDPAALSSAMHRGFGPSFDRTNGSGRGLLTMAYDVQGLSPQAFIYRDAGVTRYGLDISHPLAASVVAYAEWAGGRQAGLTSRAVAFGKATGTLPADVPVALPGDDGDSFANDAAVGASWAGARRWTINLEYHFHESGLSRNALRQWQDLARSAPNTYGQLFNYVRGYASDQQEPLVREQYFVRVSCVDAFVRNLDISAFAFVDAHDGSGFTQFTASYYVSSHWTVSALVSDTWGGRASEYGSLSQRNSLTFQAIRYF